MLANPKRQRSERCTLAARSQIIAKKKGSRLHATMLPSKEQLLSLPLLLIAQEAMRPHGWGVGALLLLALPIIPTLAVVLLLPLYRRGCTRKSLMSFRVQIIVPCCAALLALEAGLVTCASLEPCGLPDPPFWWVSVDSLHAPSSTLEPEWVHRLGTFTAT